MLYDIIIIGGGPAGITAGIYTSRQKLKTLLITKNFGGQMARKSVAIENYPGFEEISGMELIQKFEKHLRRAAARSGGQKVDIERDTVARIKKSGKKFLILTGSKNKFQAKAVIITSGADPRPLEVPGEKKFIGRGISYCTACLPPDEKVVANSSLSEIEEIKIPQKVLTIDGSFQKIKETTERNYKGELIEIKTRFFTEPARLTPEHPVLKTTIEKGKNVNYWRDFKINKPEWARANRLTETDVLLYPIISETQDIETIQLSKILGLETKEGRVKNRRETYTSHRIPNEILVNKNFLRLAGYYLSEGSLDKGGRHVGVSLYFNKREEQYIKDAKNLFEKIFKLSPTLKNRGEVVRIEIFSKIVRDFFHLLFGKYAHNKKIPHWMLFLPLEKQKEIIKGIYRGDGCKREKDFCIVTNSRNLTYQLRDILLRLKIIPSIQKRKKEELNKTPGEIDGRKIKFNHDKYHIVIGGPSLKKMSQILGVYHEKLNTRRRICKHAWIKDNHLYLPIRHIKRKQYRGKVYNLTVNKNNTYIAKNFIVHNCDAPLFSNKTVAVIGGGDSGFEAAMALSSWAKKIYILEYNSKVKADEDNQERAKKTGKVEVITSAVLKKIQGNQFVASVIYQNRKTGKNIILPLEGVFVEIGSQPATSFVKGLVDFSERDEIKIHPKTCQTKTPGLFAAGDVTDIRDKQIVVAAGEGCKAALSAYEYLQK